MNLNLIFSIWASICLVIIGVISLVSMIKIRIKNNGCKHCGRKLTINNSANSTGFAGYCRDCEEIILEEEWYYSNLENW